MEWHKQVRKLQVDITSHCNARCGACVRNQDGGETEPQLSLDHFDFDLWKRLCEEDTKGWYIGQVALNGNWGDPMMHPKLVEMVRMWAMHHPETFMTLHTNGSMRGAKFWAELAVELRKFSSHQVNFAVDGLKDTHSIYRRRTDFDKIIENIKSFNQAGGNGRMIMTLFEHNKHQVLELKDLAKNLECRAFVTRNSHSEKMRIIDKDEDYTIKAATGINEKEWRFDNNDRSISDQANPGKWIEINDYMNSLNNDETKCPWYNEGEVQIDPWGIVWPCCHVSLFGIKLDKHTRLLKEVDDTIFERRTENSLSKYNLQEILKDEWYNHHLDSVIKKAKWEVCRRTCGVCE